MGIAERRAINEFQTNHLPALTEAIGKAAGFAVPLEVNWDQIAYQGQGNRYPELWTKVFFTPVIDAFKRIGRDDMGREALKAGVSKVEFANSRNAYSTGAVTFANGVVTIDHCFSNIDDVKARTDHLVGLIERAL